LFNRSLRSRRALLLAGGCYSALIAAALPSQALAQTATQPSQDEQQQPDAAPPPATGPGEVDATTPEEKGAIVITGFRQSLQNSINIKRRERGTVEAVSAEEIGKLPDV
jgi:iron complex outermembrane receptor protein